MQKQILRVMFGFTLLLIIAEIGYVYFLESHIDKKEEDNNLVLLNEIEHLVTDENGQNVAAKEMEELKTRLQSDTMQGRKDYIHQIAAVLMAFTAVYVVTVFLYIYLKVVRPFHKLEGYADQMARGDLDIKLPYERTNFFGAFTWAFDHMREEIRYAKESEERAVAENKTIIATLSHDIKTPIASIRAYAEGLEANLDSTYEQRERYLQVIMKKCDEVTGLTDDLVLHSLSELERLEIKRQKVHIGDLLKTTLHDLEYPYVTLRQPVPDVLLTADKKRTAQVLENLLNNAGKYAAGTEVDVWADREDGKYYIHVRDHGKGISPEDMPFIFDKFYRGKNAGDKNGSGLGLYIVKYIMERMNGGVLLHNHADGLEVILWMPE